MLKKLEKFINKMLGKQEIHKRIYHFELPYKIQAVYLHYGITQLTSAGIFQRLPKDMQHKWQRALDLWHDVRVTREDLDRIDDESWKVIADKLNLHWENIDDESDITEGI